MNGLEMLLTWQFLLMSLGVIVLTKLIRTIGEYIIQSLKVIGWWNDLVMPLAPLVVGGLLGLVLSGFPYPVTLAGSGAHCLFGSVAGLLSGLVYRVVNAALSAKGGANVSE